VSLYWDNAALAYRADWSIAFATARTDRNRGAVSGSRYVPRNHLDGSLRRDCKTQLQAFDYGLIREEQRLSLFGVLTVRAWPLVIYRWLVDEASLEGINRKLSCRTQFQLFHNFSFVIFNRFNRYLQHAGYLFCRHAARNHLQHSGLA
jgi:hypothetical protein